MSKHHQVGRREFLLTATTSAAALGVGLAAAQAVAKTKVEAADPHAPKTGRLLNENEVIGLGIIGVGGMGGSHLDEIMAKEKSGVPVQIRAISDVYTRRRNWRAGTVEKNLNRKIEAYNNYKDLLARDDIHGVIIATPDHWHAQIALDALDAGKDVYGQKPMTYTLEEAVQVRDKVLATGRVFQCGAQGSSVDFWWQAREFIKKGGIGKVLWAQADVCRNSIGGPDDRGGEWNWPIDKDATDDPNGGDGYIDWQMWLGNTPKRPFSKPRFFQFRKFWDYSGGVATDLLYHVLAPLTIALDAQAPEKAVASGGIFVQHDDREVPDTFVMGLDYPDDYTVTLSSCMANRQENSPTIRGHKATIRTGNDYAMRVTPEDEFKDWFVKEFGVPEIMSPRRPRAEHMDNFLECMRTREKPALDAETAYRAMAGIRMGVEAYRQEKAIFWDGQNEVYVNEHPRPNRTSKVPSEEATKAAESAGT